MSIILYNIGIEQFYMATKHFKIKKEQFIQYEEYAKAKLDYVWFKKLMFSMMGGIFIGIGYIGTLMVTTITGLSNDVANMLKIVGALLFPVGLLLCIYLGGNLFTSNCMGIVSIVYKEKKWRDYGFDLLLTFIGNAIGCFLIALIAWAAGLFGVHGIGDGSRGAALIEIAKGKINTNGHDWWNNLFSGILCNVLIVACTMVSILTNKKGVGAFIVYLILIVFVISGYQHIVANLFVFSEAGLVSIFGTTPATTFSAAEVGKIFYINLIPTIIGNWIGGVLMSLVYLWASAYVKGQDKDHKNKKSLNLKSIHELTHQQKQKLWLESSQPVSTKTKCSCCHKHKSELMALDQDYICYQCLTKRAKQNKNRKIN